MISHFHDVLRRACTDTTALQLVIAGGILYHLGLYSLSTNNPFPVSLTLAGILVQAFASTVFVAQLFNDRGNPSRQRLSLFLLALSVSTAFTRLSRFAGFSGFDFLREVQLLENTSRTGYWDPEIGGSQKYQSSLAITLLPAMSSLVLGVPANIVLLFQTFLVTALLPMAVQVSVTSLTGNPRFGFLTGVLLAVNWFFFGAHIIAKSAPGLLLLTLALYCFSKREEKFRTIGVLFSLGVAMAHYTIALLLLFVLLALSIWSRVITRFLTRIPWSKTATSPQVSVIHTAAAALLITLWVAYAAPMVLSDLAGTSGHLLSSIGDLLSGPRRADTSLAITNSTGPVVTGWFNFQNLLIGLGALSWFIEYIRGKLKGDLLNWMLSGIFLIVLLLSWIILPWLSIRVESTRILAMILPIVTIFLARVLSDAFHLHRTALKISVFVFVFLMLPMNLMIASQEPNVLYHQLDQLPVTRRVAIESTSIPFDSNEAVASWGVAYLPLDKPLEVDAVGRYALTTSSPLPREIPFVYESSPPYGFDRYTLLSSYFVQNDLWSTAHLGGRIFSTADPSPFFSPTHNIIYSSPRFWIAGPGQ